MECPLKATDVSVDMQMRGSSKQIDCAKENCAWWISTGADGKCAVTRLALETDSLADVLSSVREELGRIHGQMVDPEAT